MIGSSRSRRIVVLASLPLALWSAFPAVQWCPLELGRDCTVARLLEAAGALPLSAAAAEQPERRALDAAPACASSTDAEAAPDGCPLAAHRGAMCGAFAGGCPRRGATASPSSRQPVAPLAGPTRGPSRGRAFCVGDPNGGPGHVTRVAGPGAALPALVARSIELDPPQRAPAPTVIGATRSPPLERDWRRPPARAPPRREWT